MPYYRAGARLPCGRLATRRGFLAARPAGCTSSMCRGCVSCLHQMACAWCTAARPHAVVCPSALLGLSNTSPPAASVTKSAVLSGRLAAVAACTKRLPVARIPEQIRIAFVRFDVIQIRCPRAANPAERVRRHEIRSCGSESAGFIPIAVYLDFSPVILWLMDFAVCARGKRRASRPCTCPHRLDCHRRASPHTKRAARLGSS